MHPFLKEKSPVLLSAFLVPAKSKPLGLGKILLTGTGVQR